ncbi:MAG: mechanosensitive ion channel [Chloroflexota bacterium]|nr:MAG: mechanosensitive ion channel [Chloroflexota bacterium]
MIEQAQPLTSILEQLVVDFLTLLPSLIAALVVFAIGVYLASIVRRLARKGLELRTKNPQPISLLSQLAYWLVVILAAAISLQMVGFNLTAFLAGLGIAGITIGFALQDVSKNFIAGLLMLIQQPFEIGEFIEVSGYAGKVEAIDLRATQVRTADGKLVSIPNGEVIVSPITNFSKAESRRVEISTGVAYESDPENARQTALEAISAVPGILNEPAPDAIFHNFGNTTFDLSIYYWIDTSQTNVSAAKDAGLNAIKQAFDQAKIDMPYPAQTVYLMQ